MRRSTTAALGLAAMTLGIGAGRAVAGTATGTVSYKGTTATVQHAYLVQGPDAVDATKTIRRLILVPKDLEATIKACTTMSCTDGDVGEGMTVDLDGGPRINYWVVLKGQLLQFSGTADPATFKTTTDEPGKLVGAFVVDATGGGGPKIDVHFDAARLKELKAAR